MAETRLFNDGWRFSRREIGSPLPSGNEAGAWGRVEIPHDWLIDDVKKFREAREGWYFKTFTLSGDKIAGKKLCLRFEGVYMDCAIYINGTEAFQWKYGYSTFELDCTEYVQSGENEVFVRVTYQPPNSRWYSGAGIYRNIWLKSYAREHIAADGVYITPLRVSGDKWRVDVDTEVTAPSMDALTLRHTLIDKNGVSITSSSGGTEQAMDISSPDIWDTASPCLYTMRTELLNGSAAVDSADTVFGFREIRFDVNEGFFLNEKHMKLNGACQHHDLGCLGAAVNRDALRRQLLILREMGVNSIRTAHNMPAVELMELADEMGFLICSEAFDMWERPKTRFDYSRFFPEWAGRDVASWVRRDRNHPSLIMWSIGNEIYDTHADDRGQELTRYLMELTRSHDPKNHAPVTIGSNYMPWENAQKCADIVGLAGYNYAEKLYESHHRENPERIIYGSETASTVQSRGIYHFPLAQSLLADDDEQCSSLGNSSTSWGARSTEACVLSDYNAPFSAGQYIWSGTDYIGEPTPYHTKNSYFGQIDTAGFPKDSFYIFKSGWTDCRDAPMVHIFPYWDFSDNQMIDIRVCSNAPLVELFFNGSSLGRRELGLDMGKLIADYAMPYQKGELLAIAYDAEGNEIARDTRKSFGDAASLSLKTENSSIPADGRGLAFIEISALDSDGNPVENANNRVAVSVAGPGRLVGLDNGDSTDYDSYKGTSKRLFSGKLLAVIASTFESGEITVAITSKGLCPASIVINSCDAEITEGVSDYLASNMTSPPSDEIPVRKISLVTSGGVDLGPERKKLIIQAVIHPHGATYDDLAWAVTDSAGIPSYIAELKVISPNEAELTAFGDGEIWVRCMTKNGADMVRLISQLRFTASGMGQVFLNPYGFISGGLYSRSNVELTNGNERGVATLRDGVSHVIFDNVDFGVYGADKITLPLFPLESNPFPIEIWEGVPENSGVHIATFTYTSGSRWNTYQEETYTLPRRLKGVTTISFVLKQKVHIKGFYFEKAEKAYTLLTAAESDAVYGDSFTRSGDNVENIGNNVTLRYDGMNFNGGIKGITICGRTPLEKNTIHVRLNGDETESAQIAEFPHSVEYTEVYFPLKSYSGLCSVEFIFLPGSEFDFSWFRFNK